MNNTVQNEALMAPEHSTRSSPWHPGEREVQRRAGVDEQMDAVGRRVIRAYMPDQHRELFEKLPHLFLGLVDQDGWPWASVVEGERGFIRSPDPTHLVVNAMPRSSDPVVSLLREGAPIALLGLEFQTRRRNRLNGRVTGVGAAGFAVEVAQSYGNCPQYIQTRDAEPVASEEASSARAEHLDVLDEAAIALVRTANTFFVASYADLEGDAMRRQVDVSHRGGKAGFVRVEGDELTIPDFPGNLFFNTLGNILETGRAGLLFVDFRTGDVLQITGEARVDFDSGRSATFVGAERLWSFRVARAIRRRGALSSRLALKEYSPNSLLTDSWEESEARLRARAIGNTWRRLRVTRIVDESASIRSFHLEPIDGAGLILPRPGQHLPIRVQPDSDKPPLVRTYTLSSAPSDSVYRISVKRQGVVSRYLHDHLAVGATLDARAPDGAFCIDATVRRPAVLISAGVGITPMIAMLRHLVYEGLRTHHLRQVHFVHGARCLRERAFDAELRGLARVAGGAVHVTHALSAPEMSTTTGRDYDMQGRIDITLLKRVLPFDDHDFYLCGPSGFMQSVYDQLRALHVPNDRIFAEAFGPASLKRTPDVSTPPLVYPAPGEGPVQVKFLASGRDARWTPDAGSLLELAEAHGLAPEFSCRGGTCGTCRTKVVKGEVTYRSTPDAPHDAGNALVCCAVPSEGTEQLVLDM